MKSFRIIGFLRTRSETRVRPFLHLLLTWLTVVFFLLSATYALAEQETITIDQYGTIIDTTTAPTRTAVTRDSNEGRNIVAAAALMEEFGWIEDANNVLNWLESGKIFSKDLDNYGITNSGTEDITIDNETIDPIDGQLNRDNPLHFFDLLHLASTLIHEKGHAHQESWYILYSGIKASFLGQFSPIIFGINLITGRTNPAEQDAYTIEICFLDAVIDGLMKRIRENQDAPPEELIKIFKKLSAAILCKVKLINGYYDKLTHYGPIPYTRADAAQLMQIWERVLEQVLRLNVGDPVDWELFDQIESELNEFMERIKPLVEEWLAGAAQRSADAEGKVDFIGTIDSISASVVRSTEYHPGDWFSDHKLVSDLFAIQGDPVDFNSPVVLIMSFNPDIISDITKINIYRYKLASGYWEKLVDGRSINSGMHTISANITGFSVLGVFIEEPIPTVSEWGLIIMAVLLLTVGAIAIRRRLITVPA